MSKVRWLAFAEGLLCAASALFWTQATWEDQLGRNIVARATEQALTDEERVLAIMHTVHRLMDDRRALYLPVHSLLRDRLIRSVDAHLIDANQMCGSSARVLARFLQLDGRDVRLGIMRGSSGGWGVHTVVLTPVEGRWVVLDAFYDLAFRDEQGRLLGPDEIRDQWGRFAGHLPPGYKPDYDYRGMRYSDWRGVPVEWLGSWTRDVSLGTYVLNQWRVCALVSSAALVVALIVDVRAVRARRRSTAAEVPIGGRVLP